MTTDREPRLERFSDNEDLTLLFLGARAWLDRFAAALEPRAVEAGEAPEALVWAALGLLSLRRTLRRWENQAAVETQAPAPRPEVALSGLMR